MRNRILSYLKPPGVWNDEAEYRRAEVIHIAHVVLFLGSFVYLLVPSWIINGQTINFYAIVFMVVIGSLLLRTGRLRLSSLWMLGLLWLVFAVGSAFEGGIASSSFAGLIAMVVFAGLGWGIRPMVILACMTVAAGGLLVYLHTIDALPPSAVTYTHLNILSDFTVYVTVTAIFMTVAIRRIEKSLAQFQKELREKKKTEEALRESQALYISLVEHMPAGVFRKDAEGRYIFVNTIFCRLKGLHAHEILGRTPNELSEYEKQVEACREPDEMLRHRTLADAGTNHHELIMRTGKPLEVEEEYTNPDGSRQFMRVVKSPVFSSDGKVVGSQGILFDVTERKMLEHQLVQVQKLEGIGTLAGGIAHDFNNILAMIMGSAEMLRLRIGDQPDLTKFADRIIGASQRGTSISRQLLIFSRPETPEFKEVSLPQIISELRDMLTHFLSKSITIRTDIQSDGGSIRGDAGQIHQAVLNLAINAGDAMKNNGTLTIRVWTVAKEAMRRHFGLSDDRCYAAVSVADTGTGIDTEKLEKIFDPFFTTKEKGKGTGLGLSIVHGIVKSHHGFIDVDSVPGKGTTFTMYFPMVR
ncbi:MAG: two-component system sensor histidine kinase NtrB [Acidobacteriota bacterium]